MTGALMQFGPVESSAMLNDLIPAYPDARAVSEQLACSFLQSRPRERPRPELRRPVTSKSAPYEKHLQQQWHATLAILPLSLPACQPLPCTYLVKVKHQVQLTHIPKKLVQHLDEEMDSLEIGKLVIIGINTDAEEQPRISPIDNLRAPSEFYEIRLVFLISRRDESMYLGWPLAGCCWSSRPRRWWSSCCRTNLALELHFLLILSTS